ncbi:hypothetical protein GCK72_020954 [Caenorhabditis remanei]|uniref:DUF38 domain-containing protein n=1 Tax=Caenorhabditis remanei TaxID=31234 RepID=A0A6A5GI86_CAERE|nr:hypothetical protein GCK72_020954 [Caenorhabditis remanei]KAF1754393.1 hypothetical protein GCK72_020954 [Caenorhabditis remanei]
MVIRAFELVHHKSNGRLESQQIVIANNAIINCFIADGAFPDGAVNAVVMYQQFFDDCFMVSAEPQTSFVENSNFVLIFCEDLREILLEQNFALQGLSIYTVGDYDSPDFITSPILDTIKTSLSLKSVKMVIESLHLEIFRIEQVLDLLSYINLKRLNRLVLRIPATDAQVDFEQLLALDIWREFENFVVKWHTILITSRIFKTIRICFEHLDHEKVKEILSQRIHGKICRLLRVPNSINQVLATELDENSITVSRDQDKYKYDFLATDEDFIPLAVSSDWSKTLENKTIIELLLDHLGFIEIQTLRKVCSNIRTCIDHYKPDPNLTKLGIIVKELCYGEVDIKMGFMDGSYRETSYEKVQYGCKVGDILLPEQDMHEICLNDLMTIMPRKEFHLEEFEFAVPCTRYSHVPELFAQKKEFVEKLEKLLIPNNVLMKARKFIYFENCHETDQMPNSILWLEPISLELIEMHSDKRREAKMNEVMKLIMDSNQWQYAKEYVMKEFAFLGKVNPDQFVHFSKIDITVENWTNEDFFNWQEEVLYSPSFIKYKISFRNCSIDNDIYNLLGLPFRTVNGRTTWYFKMPEKNLVLHVIYYASKSVIFTRVDIEDVPEVVVMNFDVQLID